MQEMQVEQTSIASDLGTLGLELLARAEFPALAPAFARTSVPTNDKKATLASQGLCRRAAYRYPLLFLAKILILH